MVSYPCGVSTKINPLKVPAQTQNVTGVSVMSCLKQIHTFIKHVTGYMILSPYNTNYQSITFRDRLQNVWLRHIGVSDNVRSLLDRLFQTHAISILNVEWGIQKETVCIAWPHDHTERTFFFAKWFYLMIVRSSSGIYDLISPAYIFSNGKVLRAKAILPRCRCHIKYVLRMRYAGVILCSHASVTPGPRQTNNT